MREATVYIVEDDASFRKSIERLLRVAGFKTTAFGTAQAFLAQASIGHPACLVLDVQLPDMDGLRLQQELLEKGDTLPIIFMTGHGNIPMSVQAMKKGAVDFLPKPFAAKDLRIAISKAIEIDARAIKSRRLEKQIKALVATLTPREKEVLCWIITGKLNKQIAEALGTSEKTVKVHRRRVFQKTKVSSVAELVRLAEKIHIQPAVPNREISPKSNRQKHLLLG